MLLSTAVVLVACGNETKEQQSISQTRQETTTMSTTIATTSTKNKEVKSGPLTEVGQYTYQNGNGKVELIKIATPNVEKNSNNVTITIKEIKLLKTSELTNKAIDFWSQHQVNIDDYLSNNNIYTLQVKYDVKNDNDVNIGFSQATIKSVISSDGIEFDKVSEQLLKISPHAKKTDNASVFIIKGSSEFNDITFYTGDILRIEGSGGYHLGEGFPINVHLGE
ncbi:hypothetical protein GMA11_08760 [Granulicatella sp. zg-ZJ]|uniref:hypothetical protein n=1 Tax=Granulicatella sp. zg-ZJ TaxID=2678504 RepID=UPI0013D40FEC|nr:hypothetical protein [Granulicatella sp. zg-ZJ]NEW63463.1 hypothetical protein [Granulicatella sp. zg-ZJ]